MCRKLLIVAIIFLLPTEFARAQQDQAPEVESQVPGKIELARWQLVLNSGGADAFKKVATPVDSASKVYQAYTANGYELRQAMADAITNGGAESANSGLDFAQPNGFNGSFYLQNLYFNSYNPRGANIQGNASTADAVSRPDDLHMHIAVNDAINGLQIRNGARMRTVNGTPLMQRDVDLSPGDAAAFLAEFPVAGQQSVYQLTVFEAFKAYDPMVRDYFQSEHSAQWWCTNGPETLRKWGSIAAMWEAHAAHTAQDAPPEFTKKLSDGKVVKLVAIGNPSQSPFCWWDAKGNSVSGALGGMSYWQGDPPNQIQVQVTITGPASEQAKQWPVTRPSPGYRNNYPGGGIGEMTSYQLATLAEGATGLEVGVPVGDWQEIGQMSGGDSQDFDGVTYSLTKPTRLGDAGFYLQMNQTGNDDDLIAFSAVDKNGYEAQSFNGQSQMVFGKSSQRSTTFGLNFNGFGVNDLQYFRVCKRKREWFTFSGFAISPATAISTSYTPDEVEAAMSKRTNVIIQPSPVTIGISMDPLKKALRGIQKSQWEAIAPDATAPMGAAKLALNSAAAGDEKTVRQMLTSQNAADGPALDLMAHVLTLTDENWNKAVKLFGEDALADLPNNSMIRDLPQRFMMTNWNKQPDGTWIGDRGGLNLRKVAAGHYTLDLTDLVKEQAGSLDEMLQFATKEESISEMLDKKGVTIEQLKAAVSPATTKP